MSTNNVSSKYLLIVMNCQESNLFNGSKYNVRKCQSSYLFNGIGHTEYKYNARKYLTILLNGKMY